MEPLIVVEIVAIACCLVGIAAFSLAEASLVAANKIRLRQVLDDTEIDEKTGQAVERMSRESERLLTTVIVGINIPVLLASALTTHLVGQLRPTDEHLVEFVSLGMIATILVFCEILPKSYAVQRAEVVAVRIARPMQLLSLVLHYPTQFVMMVSRRVIRWVGAEPGQPTESLTEEDLRELVEMGQEEGILEDGERKLLDGVLDFGDTIAREVMSPRPDMVGVPKEADTAEVLAVMQKTGHSRIPMYDGQIDNILGVVYLNDLVSEIVSGNAEMQPADCLREPVFVPETKKIDEVFREFQRRRIHIAIVVDEHGGVAGLLTMEDVLEEIFGEIRDEHDSQEEPLILRQSDGVYLVDARATRDDLKEELGLELPEGEFDTLAGYLIEVAGRLPTAGDSFTTDVAVFTVAEVDGLRLRRIKVELRCQPATDVG